MSCLMKASSLRHFVSNASAVQPWREGELCVSSAHIAASRVPQQVFELVC